jgi:DNA-binding GntR family transcriptional regulator
MPIPNDYSAPIRMSAKERTLTELQRWIIEGTLQPGEKLNDGQLAEALGVSRTPVREALQLLEVQGFIEMHPGRDTRVTTINKEDVQKMFPPLAALHALAAEQVASKILSEQIERLREINAEFAKVVEEQQPFLAMELDEQFHAVIIEAADNPYISSFSHTIQLHIRRFKFVFLQQLPLAASHASIDEHSALIEAFERRDRDKAAALMKENWLRPMRELFQGL